MVQQLGLPCLFETFSYADKYWDDLRQVLAIYEPKLLDKDLPKEEFLDLMEKTTEENPHVVNSFFVNKFEIYLNEFMKKSMDITAYWISWEWQKRGQIHCHMLIWMKDQPDIMEALNCKDKEKQDELLQNACDW